MEEIGAPDGPAAVRLHFMGGGPPVVASTVVGCDGVRSVLRQRLLGDPLQFLGALVVLGVTGSMRGSEVLLPLIPRKVSFCTLFSCSGNVVHVMAQVHIS